MIDFEFFLDNFDIYYIVAIVKRKYVVVVAEIDKHDFKKKNCEINRK